MTDLSLAPTAPNRDQGDTEFDVNMAAMMEFIEAWPPELNAWAAEISQLAVGTYNGTSASSVAIGTGTKNFTASTGRGWIPGQNITVAYDATNYMTGTVTSYNSGTGALVVDVTAVTGSGTYAVWSIGLSGVTGFVGGTLTALLVTLASATGGAGLRLPHGAAPTSPTNGDLWSTTGGFFGRVNGTTHRLRGNVRVVAAGGTSGSQAADADITDQFALLGLTGGTTIAAPTGTPLDGQKLMIHIEDNGTGRALTWNAIFLPVGVALPSTTVANKEIYVGCIYRASTSKWNVVGVSQEA